MIKNKMVTKKLITGIIILIFTMSIIPLVEAENIIAGKNNYTEKMSEDIKKTSNNLITNSPTCYINGEIGDNHWYISCVLISFSYFPGAEEIYFRIDQGNYQKYQYEPVEYCVDGTHTVFWYWTDDEGGEHPGEPSFFKLDQTPPNIVLTKKSGLNDKKTFTANCEDEHSGVERVEFYLDDELQDTYFEAPYKWTWTGTEAHMVYAIGYNFAGLSEKSNTISTPRSLLYNSPFANKFSQLLYNIIIWIQQFT